MRRFFVASALLGDDEICLEGEAFHHLGHVLRLRAGDEVELLDGHGLSCHCRIESIDGRSARLRVVRRRDCQDTGLPIRLIQGIPKGEKMELILQKGTELGVSAFVPFFAERSLPRPSAGRGASRQQRWERIVREAARQCGRATIPEVAEAAGLGQALEGSEDLRLLLWEEESLPLGEVLAGGQPRAAALVIGPEGGLSPAEVALARQAGYQPVALGSRILRTETAGLAAVAILQYLYGDLAVAARRRVADPPIKELP